MLVGAKYENPVKIYAISFPQNQFYTKNSYETRWANHVADILKNWREIMKKRLLLLVTVLLTAGILFGCNTSNQNTAATPTSTAENDVAENEKPQPGNPELPLVDEPFTISIWAPTSSSIQKTMTNLSESAYYQDLEKITGISVEFTHPALGEEKQSFTLLIASGEYPDIIELQPGYDYPGGLDKGIEDGVLLRLNELIEQYAPNYKALLDSDPQIMKEATTDTGNMPCFYSISVDGAQPPWMGMVVRKDWLDELDLDIPVTYDDWYVMLKAFKEEKNAVAPLMLYNTGFEPLNIFEGGYNFIAEFYQVDGVVKYGPLSPDYEDYITMMAQWYAEGLIDPDFTTKKDFTPSRDFTTTEKTGAFYDIYFNLSVLKGLSSNPDYELVAVSTPKVNKDDVLHVRQTNTITGMVSWALSSACEDPATVVRWIDYGYSPEGEILAAYGIEGETFEYNEEGKPEFNEFIYNNPDGLSLAEAYNYYAKHGGAVAYHWDREWAGQPQHNLDCLGIWSKDNDGAYAMPPATLSADEGTEYAQIMGDIETYVNEMVVKFILGEEPLSNYDSFVEQVKSMNIDRAIELKQAALDRFNAR